MKTPAFVSLLALIVGASFAGMDVRADLSPALEALQGKWSTVRTNEEGVRTVQILTIAEDHFDVTIRDDKDAVRFVAKGKVVATKEGPFQVFRTSHIKMGPSEDQMKESDEDRDSVYSIRDERLYLAANFDREDGDRTPAFYVFEKGTAAGEALQGGPSMVGEWRLELTIQGQELDYTLMLKKEEEQFKGNLISPRTGSYPIRPFRLDGRKFKIYIDRLLGDQEVTFIYEGELDKGGHMMKGRTIIEGAEDQFNGTFKAQR